jgi:hypothetical protein
MLSRSGPAIVLMLLLVPAVPRGTVLVPAEFREIVNGSDIIAFGRVSDAAPEWSDDRRRIDTLVTFDVGTYLKGGPGATIVFRVPGGQVGRYRNVTVGAPVFRPGDEAVLFLRRTESGEAVVFGLSQGVFRVRTEGATRRRIVVAPALMAQSGAPEVVVRGAGSRRSQPLERFGAQVQAVLAEAAARSAR